MFSSPKRKKYSENLSSWRKNLNTMSKKWAAALANNIPGIEHDLQFLVGEDRKPISGHKLVLGVCSPVFQVMFSEQFKTEGGEAKTTIEIPDVDFNGMRNIFNYAYTGEMNVDVQDAVTTMYTAHKYDIQEMVDHCSNILKSNLSAQTSATVYQAAVFFDDKELMTKVEKFIVRNFESMLDSDGFLCLTKDQLCGFLKADDLYAPSEIVVFNGFIRWGDHQCMLQDKEKTDDTLREVLEGVVGHIRMSSITAKEFSSVIAPSKVFSTEQMLKLYPYFLHRQEDKNKDLLLEELSLPTSRRYIQISEKIVELYSEFTPLLREYGASELRNYGHNYVVSFKIEGDERDPLTYLKGLGFMGRSSKLTETNYMKIKVAEIDSKEDPEPITSLFETETSYTAEANKTKMIDLDKSVKIVPNKEYGVYLWPTVGGVAFGKIENKKKNINLYNEEDGLRKPVKLTVTYPDFIILHSLKFSFSE